MRRVSSVAGAPAPRVVLYLAQARWIADLERMRERLIGPDGTELGSISYGYPLRRALELEVWRSAARARPDVGRMLDFIGDAAAAACSLRMQRV